MKLKSNNILDPSKLIQLQKNSNNTCKASIKTTCILFVSLILSITSRFSPGDDSNLAQETNPQEENNSCINDENCENQIPLTLESLNYDDIGGLKTKPWHKRLFYYATISSQQFDESTDLSTSENTQGNFISNESKELSFTAAGDLFPGADFYLTLSRELGENDNYLHWVNEDNKESYFSHNTEDDSYSINLYLEYRHTHNFSTVIDLTYISYTTDIDYELNFPGNKRLENMLLPITSGGKISGNIPILNIGSAYKTNFPIGEFRAAYSYDQAFYSMNYKNDDTFSTRDNLLTLPMSFTGIDPSLLNSKTNFISRSHRLEISHSKNWTYKFSTSIFIRSIYDLDYEEDLTTFDKIKTSPSAEMSYIIYDNLIFMFSVENTNLETYNTFVALRYDFLDEKGRRRKRSNRLGKIRSGVNQNSIKN